MKRILLACFLSLLQKKEWGRESPMVESLKLKFTKITALCCQQLSVWHFPRPDLTPVLWSTQCSRPRPAENSTDKSQTFWGEGGGVAQEKKTVCRSAA